MFTTLFARIPTFVSIVASSSHNHRLFTTWPLPHQPLLCGFSLFYKPISVVHCSWKAYLDVSLSVMIYCIDTHTFTCSEKAWRFFIPMVIYYNIGANFSTPEHRTPSDPTWSAWTPNDSLFTPPKSTLQTPCGGKKSTSRTAGLPRSRASPYMTPEQSRISVFKPKDLIEKARQKKASLMSSPMTAPTHPHVAGSTDTPGRPWTKPKSKLFPPNSGVRKRLPMVKPRPLVSPPMQGTPRRVLRKPLQDTSRPTVELLRVLNKCWDEDGAKESSWALTDGLLNGRNDERDRSGRWKVLGHAVGSLWPDLRGWIMANAPEDGDTNWFISQRKIDIDDEIEGCIHDPKLATKDSSVDRVGFHSS